jgi:hypothetical protein
VVLESGWVIVGSLPTSDGTSASAQAGCLIVLDNMGNPVETFFGSLISGPWDMTAFEDGRKAKLFVTNVLNGTVAANGAVVNRSRARSSTRAAVLRARERSSGWCSIRCTASIT